LKCLQKNSTNIEEAFIVLITNIESSVGWVHVDPPNQPTSNINKNALFRRICGMFKSGIQISHESFSVYRSMNSSIISSTKISYFLNMCSKHVALAANQVNNVRRVFDNKMSILDRLFDAVKKRVYVGRNPIITRANIDRD
jgi:hypothetical protein